MEIYLIRHTKPDIAKGVCYGQADLDVVESFEEEAACIKEHLPEHFDAVYSSPLKRCRQLAERLFPDYSIRFDDRIKEINCGDWELKKWDDIEQEHLKRWMNDFVNECTPSGESYTHLYDRVVQFFESLDGEGQRIAIVSHGGVIRSLLSYIEAVALKDSFKQFSIHYGCVVRIDKKDDGFVHAILHNRQVEQEQHRPSYS